MMYDTAGEKYKGTLGRRNKEFFRICKPIASSKKKLLAGCLDGGVQCPANHQPANCHSTRKLKRADWHAYWLISRALIGSSCIMDNLITLSLNG